MVAGFLITMGNLGDRIGRRRLLLIGAGAFGIASIVASYSNSAEMLIATRAVLGIAGATLAPSTLSLIRNMFHNEKQRTVAIGIWSTSYSVGGAIGPLIGGTLLEHFSWGAVFLIAVPVMVLLLILGPILLPEYRDPSAHRLDLTSTLFSLAAVLPVIYGLKKIAEKGLGVLPVACIITGIIIGVVFFQRQKKLPDPLIDVKLFRVPYFSVSLLAYALATFVAFGNFIFIFQYMELIAGLSPLHAGLWSLPSFIAYIIGSMLAPRIVQRIPPAYVIGSGLLLSAVGFGMLTQVNSGADILLLAIASFIYYLGLAPVFTLTTDMIVGAAPPERAGAAAAISETGSEFGGAFGIAIIGSIGMIFYRNQLAGAIPSGIPPQVTETAKATLNAAIDQAHQLPAASGSALLDAAKKAFLSGMHISAVTCAVVVTGLAILSIKQLRRVQTGTTPG